MPKKDIQTLCHMIKNVLKYQLFNFRPMLSTLQKGIYKLKSLVLIWRLYFLKNYYKFGAENMGAKHI